jgi:hypothetical protein
MDIMMYKFECGDLFLPTHLQHLERTTVLCNRARLSLQYFNEKGLGRFFPF